MTLALADVIDLSGPLFWVGLVVFLRVGAMMALIPAFGEQSVPARVRLAITFAFASIVAPAVAPIIAEQPEGARALVALLGMEVAIGLFLGILLRLFVLVLSIAGAIAAQSTSLSQIFGGSAGVDPQPAIGNLLVISGLTIAVILGLHVRLVEMMIGSYQLFPAGGGLDPGFVSEIGVARVAQGFGFAFTLAAPFVIASLIYNVTLGVINRAMPQLMVSFVGAPVITAGGLILMLLSMPLLLGLWSDALNEFLANPMGPIR